MPRLAQLFCGVGEVLPHIAVEVQRLSAASLGVEEEHEDAASEEDLPSWPKAHLGPQLAVQFSEVAWPEIRDAQAAALPLTLALPEHAEMAPALPGVLVQA